MSNVKLKEIPFGERYVKLIIDGHFQGGPMVANLRRLYEFIGTNSPGNPKYTFGNGCRAILRKARTLAGYRTYMISKKQVFQLVNAYCNRDDDTVEYVKIPYASDYIFRAIFSILDEYKATKGVVVPLEITELYGKIRREVFYAEQSRQYHRKYEEGLLNNRPELDELRRELLNDLCSEACALGRKV